MSFVAFMCFGRVPVAAQSIAAPPPGYKQDPGTPSSTMPAPLREIGFDQNIDGTVPLDTVFRDESGRTVRLGEYFGKRPVVMVFAYYDCPMLCALVVNGLVSFLGGLSLELLSDFEIVTVICNSAVSTAG